MKLSIHLLPLAPQGPANSLFPASRLLEPEHKFLHIASDDATIGELFAILEEKCKKNYFHEFEHDRFAIKKLQDRDGNDLPVEYTLRDVFAGETQPITLKVHQARPDRESSVPVTSSLRPAHLRTTQKSARRSSKPAKQATNGDGALQAYAHVNADTPIRSSEPSVQLEVRNGIPTVGKLLAGEQGELPLSASRSQRTEVVLKPPRTSSVERPKKHATAPIQPPTSQDSAFQFVKPALPPSKAQSTSVRKARQDETSASKATTNGSHMPKSRQASKRTQSQRTSLTSQHAPVAQVEAEIIDISDEEANNAADRPVEEVGSLTTEGRDEGGLRGNLLHNASSDNATAISKLPPASTPQQRSDRRTSSGSNISSGKRPMLPADVLESLKRRRRLNGDDSDLDLPPNAKSARRSSTKPSEVGALPVPGDGTNGIEDASPMSSTQTGPDNDGRIETASIHDMTPVDKNSKHAVASTAKKSKATDKLATISRRDTVDGPSRSSKGSSTAMITETSERESLADIASTAKPNPKPKATPTRGSIQKSVLKQQATSDICITRPVQSTPKPTPPSTRITSSASKGASGEKTGSASKRIPVERSLQGTELTCAEMEPQTQRKIEADRRAKAAEARKQELREEYQRQKERRSQEEGYTDREAAALEYFKADGASKFLPKSGDVASSSQITSVPELSTPSGRQPTGFLKKPSPITKGRRVITLENPETMIPASSIPAKQTEELRPALSPRGTVTSAETTAAVPTLTGEKRKRSICSSSASGSQKRPKLAASSSQQKAAERSFSNSSSQDRLLQMEIDFPKMSRVTETPSASPMELPRLPDTQDSVTSRAVADTLKFLETSDPFDDDDEDVDDSTHTLLQPTMNQTIPIALDGSNSDPAKSTQEPGSVKGFEVDGVTDPTENTADPMMIDLEFSESYKDEEGEVTLGRDSVESERAPARLVLDESSSSRASSSELEEEEANLEPFQPSSFPFPSSQPRHSSSSASASGSPELGELGAEEVVPVLPTTHLKQPSCSSVSASPPPATYVPPPTAAERFSESSVSSSSSSASVQSVATASNVSQPLQAEPAAMRSSHQTQINGASDTSSSSSSEESSDSEDDDSDDQITSARGKSTIATNGKANSKLHKLAKFVKKLDRNPEEEKRKLSRAITFGNVRPV